MLLPLWGVSMKTCPACAGPRLDYAWPQQPWPMFAYVYLGTDDKGGVLYSTVAIRVAKQ